MRIAATWMNDGDWIMTEGLNDHPDYPLGTVIFFMLEDPSGNVIDGTQSWLNNNNDWQRDPWAVVDCTPAVSGRYAVGICRYNTYSFNKNGELNLAMAVTAR